VTIDPSVSDLVVALVAAILGWFTRHFTKPNG
jgi:hypothetical protein